MAKVSPNLPYLILAGVIVIGIVIAFAVIRPQIDTLLATRETVRELERELAERQAFLRSVDRKTAELQTHQALEHELQVVMPDEAQFDSILRVVDRSAAAGGAAVISVDNTTQKVEATLRTRLLRTNQGGLPADIRPIGFNVSVSGTYQQLRQFIDAMEKSIRLADVTSIEVTRNEQNVEQLTLDASVRAYTYNAAR